MTTILEFILDSFIILVIILLVITPKANSKQLEGIYKREIIAEECNIACWKRESSNYDESVNSIIQVLEKNIDKNDLINCNVVNVDFQDDKNLFGFIFCDGVREIASYYFNSGDFTVDKWCLSMFVYNRIQKKHGQKKLLISFMEK